MNCSINSASNFSGLQAGISPISLFQLAGSVRKSTLNRPFIFPILSSEEFPQNAEVELINSRLAYYQGLGLDVVAFPVSCAGHSVVETGESLGRTFLYPSPTHKCDIVSGF